MTVKYAEFGQRIRSRAKDMQLKQKEFGGLTGASTASISKWFGGYSMPHTKYLALLATALKTTPQWLLTGEDDSPEHIVNVAINTKSVGKRIQEKMWDKKVNQTHTAKFLNLNAQTVGGWVRGNNIPKGENIEMLAAYLDTTPEWILTGRDSKSIKAEKERALLNKRMAEIEAKPKTQAPPTPTDAGETTIDTQVKAETAQAVANQEPTDDVQLDSFVNELWKKAYDEGYAQAQKDIQALWDKK